jgi:hypothetical protein
VDKSNIERIGKMKKKLSYQLIGLVAGAFACFCGWFSLTNSSRAAGKPNYIEGTVKSSKGPEAGVWVIAETTELPTKYIKIVVTDDRGRYVLPELPQATYNVWVRGYGLVDSKPVPGHLGQNVDLTAVVAPNGRAAAEVYPANYWLSLLKIPKGNLSQERLITDVKNCLACHQIGDKATREISDATKALGTFKSSLEVWDRRTKAGPMGASMGASFMALGAQREMFADWTDRIAAGEYPKEAPPRPTGVERNVVLTLRDWGAPDQYMHDSAASDIRDPHINAKGDVYAVSQTDDTLVWLAPGTNEVGLMKVPSKAPFAAPNPGNLSSPYWGDQQVWQYASEPRSSAIDNKGRLWFSARIRGREQQPSFCTNGSANKYAQYYPMPNGNKQIGFYDPETRQITGIDTCFTTDHNELGPDGSLFFGATNAIGWVNTATYDKTHNDEASQGWGPVVLDINGDGKITKPWTEPNDPVDPTKDHRINFSCYKVAVSPVDGSAWCSGIGPRTLVRLERGSNPPETMKGEVYEPPMGNDPEIFMSGGVDVDSNGVVWQNWRGSDYITSFDRRKCKVLNGPTATGQQCPEGWTTYRKQEPTFQDAGKLNSDMSYLMDVDRHNVSGLGKDVVMTGYMNSDSVLVLVPQSRQWVTLRMPYPMGYFPRAVNGRIDDPKAGWKGRALWTSYNLYAPWHAEGGKGSKNKVVEIQIRPDPLAK